MSREISVKSLKWTIPIVALGYWSAALTNGALRVVVPVYFAATGMAISKIAFLFFLFKFAEIFAPLGIGLMLNRWGYKKTFISGLALHSAISCFYLAPSVIFVYIERFVRGLVYMADMSAVYIKHFAAKEKQFYLINMMLGLKEASKGIGMIGGGLLIAVISIEHTITLFSVLTMVSAIVAIAFLPDLREQVKTPVLKIWGTADKRIKTLGLGFGLLNGALDAWGVVVLPVYLTKVMGVSPAFVGTVMMVEYLIQGAIVTLYPKLMSPSWEPRKMLIICELTLVPVCFAMALVFPLYAFLSLVGVYMLFFSIAMVYYNHLMLDFASKEKTSLDLATYTTLTNIFKPVGVFASGYLAESLGFGSAYYFAALLTVCSAITCLGLPKTENHPRNIMEPYVAVSAGAK